MIDLHCHSTVSDGTLTPAELVRAASENGCTLLALTDHDHTGGLHEARQTAQTCGITLINGVEISVTWRGNTVHIVGLDFDADNPVLQKLLVQNRSGRIERIHRIGEKLAKQGIHGAAEAALSIASNPETVSRTHLAEFLIQQGYVRNKQQAFTKYLGHGKAAAVAHEWATLQDAVEAIIQANGIAVVAHPMRYHFSATGKRRLLEEFKSYGGQAVEVQSGSSGLNDRLNYALLAERFHLLASVGSDFHAYNRYSGGTLGVCPELPPICRPVWEHFRQSPISRPD